MLSIIVCSRNKELSSEFLRNIDETIAVDYEVICIDNSKNDYSIYSAYNKGINQSRFPYLCFVHEDVYFHHKNWGKKVIEHLQIPDIGIIGLAGGDIASRVPAMWSTLNPCENLIQSFKNDRKPSELVQLPANYTNTRRSVILLDGVFLCMNRIFFENIKFDETFGGFHGYDYDISIQSIIAGFNNYVIYDISIEHFSPGIQDNAYYRTLVNVFQKWEHQLPLFEKSIPKAKQEKLLPLIEEKTIKILIKRLVRTYFAKSEILKIIPYYLHLTNSKNLTFKIKFLKFRILSIRINSFLRKKMHKSKVISTFKNYPKTEPKVSIITPCFNREKFIGDTLKNLQMMNYQNWECIVVDDDSTDNSAVIVKEMAAKDKRIQYHYQRKSAIPVTKNYAISLSTGKYIFPLDSDDLISPDYIREAVDILENNENVKIVYCQGVYFGTRKGKWKLPTYSFEELLISNCIHNSAMFRRSDFDKTNGYNPSIFASEEWDLWINMLKSGGDVYKIEKDYFFYRKHAASTIDNLSDKRSEMRKLVYENNKELYEQFLENPIQLLVEHRKYKQRYNKLRRLILAKPLE